MIKIKGHSLAELLVAMAIVGILLSTASPALSKMAEVGKTTYAINQMLGALQHTRSSAAFTHQNTTLCPGELDCLDTANWGNSLLIFQDRNSNKLRDSDEPLLRQEQLPDDYTWHWSSFRKLTHIIYQPDGTTLAANGTLTLCKKGKAVQQIVLSLSGRVRQQAPRANAPCH